MISDEGTPKLIHFGLAQVIDDFAEVAGYTTSSFASSLRWSAPELLNDVSSLLPKTSKSDVYVVGSTGIEVGVLQICFSCWMGALYYPIVKLPQLTFYCRNGWMLLWVIPPASFGEVPKLIA